MEKVLEILRKYEKRREDKRKEQGWGGRGVGREGGE